MIHPGPVVVIVFNIGLFSVGPLKQYQYIPERTLGYSLDKFKTTQNNPEKPPKKFLETSEDIPKIILGQWTPLRHPQDTLRHTQDTRVKPKIHPSNTPRNHQDTPNDTQRTLSP